MRVKKQVSEEIRLIIAHFQLIMMLSIGGAAII